MKIYNIKDEVKKMSFPDVLSKIDSFSPASNVVITGKFKKEDGRVNINSICRGRAAASTRHVSLTHTRVA